MQLLRVSGKATKLGNTMLYLDASGKRQLETGINGYNLLRSWKSIVTNPESYSFNEDPKNL